MVTGDWTRDGGLVPQRRCFVAMAMGVPEMNKLFELSLRPVLKTFGIAPIAINRRESNRDITLEIMELLGKADMCVADLTYARPSVYFEAGYAERSVPVIYTARKDHLDRKGQADHLRVHFDLEHRPIVDWRAPDDGSFRARLRRRIRATVTPAWREDDGEQRKALASQTAFSRLSHLEQRARIIATAISVAGAHGYREHGAVRSPSHRPVAMIRAASKRDRDTMRVVFFLGTEHALSSAVKSFGQAFILNAIAEKHLESLDLRGVVRVRTDFVILSSTSARPDTVTRALSSWRGSPGGRSWTPSESQAARVRGHEYPHRIDVVPLGGLRSVVECRASVASLFEATL